MRWNPPTGRINHTAAAVVLAVLGSLLPSPRAFAQQPGPGVSRPRLLTVMPPGGRAGSKVEVTLTGQDL
ncbi:MAG: hypothetical protein JO112_10700, partial [Planctomycetes bacterium]|nr:hypothetical protein [Planctomycetota bacterium]